MIKSIKKITLIFENTGYVDIDADFIKDIDLQIGKDEIRKIARNSIDRMQTFKKVHIVFSKDINIIADTYYESISVFKRLSRNDITVIGITYENDEYENFFTPWNPASEYVNSYRKCIKNNNNDIEIIIKK